VVLRGGLDPSVLGRVAFFFYRKIRFFFQKKTNGRNIPTLAIVVVLSGKPGALVNDQTTDNHRDLEKNLNLLITSFQNIYGADWLL
jgi:hypothetical protein